MPNIQPLIENQYIKLGTAAVIAVTVIGFAMKLATYQANLDRDMQELRKAIAEMDSKIVGRSPEGWHKTQMRSWCDRTELINRDLNWKCPMITSEWP